MFESFILYAQQLITQFSYLGVFVLSIIGTSTILIPFPIYTIIFFAAGLGLNPLAVGVVAGLGSAVGELTGYLIGLGGRVVMEQKRKITPKFVTFFTKLFKKRSQLRIDKKHITIDYAFFVILATSFLPFPFDVIGILSGISNYDIKKFYIAVAIGKIAKCLLIAYAGYVAIPLIEHFLTAM